MMILIGKELYEVDTRLLKELVYTLDNYIPLLIFVCETRVLDIDRG